MNESRLSVMDLAQRWGLTDSTIYRLQKNGELPELCTLKDQPLKWFRFEIEHWEKERADEQSRRNLAALLDEGRQVLEIIAGQFSADEYFRRRGGQPKQESRENLEVEVAELRRALAHAWVCVEFVANGGVELPGERAPGRIAEIDGNKAIAFVRAGFAKYKHID